MKRFYKALICASIFITNTRGAYAEAPNRFSDFNDVQNYIYENLQERNNLITFTYSGDKKEFISNLTNIIKSAYSEDDYTERSWFQIEPKASVSGSSIDTSISISYLTTKEQESYIDTEIKSIEEELIKPSMTDEEKISAINEYLISRFDYDYTLQSNNVYSALKTGKTACQGYSMAAYKMLNLAGVKNRIIIGTLNGKDHSWNYVKLGSKWYHLDVTNNDTTKDKYFLVSGDILESNGYSWNKENYPQVMEK